MTFGNLTEGQEYTIEFVEKTSEGKTQSLSPYTFVTPGGTNTEE